MRVVRRKGKCYVGDCFRTIFSVIFRGIKHYVVTARNASRIEPDKGNRAPITFLAYTKNYIFILINFYVCLFGVYYFVLALLSICIVDVSSFLSALSLFLIIAFRRLYCTTGATCICIINKKIN